MRYFVSRCWYMQVGGALLGTLTAQNWTQALELVEVSPVFLGSFLRTM